MDLKKKITLNSVIQILMFIALIAIDQLTKYLAVVNLKDKEPSVLIDGVLEFQYLENSGAAFSLFQNRQWLFYIITAIVLIVIFFLWIRGIVSQKQYSELKGDQFKKKTFSNGIFLNYILMLLAAGAVGNLYDRIVNHYVVDFIYVRLINFPIFNFADICVTISAVLLVVFFIFIYKDDPNYHLFSGFKKKEESSGE